MMLPGDEAGWQQKEESVQQLYKQSLETNTLR